MNKSQGGRNVDSEPLLIEVDDEHNSGNCRFRALHDTEGGRGRLLHRIKLPGNLQPTSNLRASQKKHTARLARHSPPWMAICIRGQKLRVVNASTFQGTHAHRLTGRACYRVFWVRLQERRTWDIPGLGKLWPYIVLHRCCLKQI